MERGCIYCIQGNCYVHVKNKHHKNYKKNKGKIKLESSDSSDSSDSEEKVKKINVEKLVRNMYPIREVYHPYQQNIPSVMIQPQFDYFQKQQSEYYQKQQSEYYKNQQKIITRMNNVRDPVIRNDNESYKKFDVNEIVIELLEKQVNPDIIKQIMNDIIRT